MIEIEMMEIIDRDTNNNRIVGASKSAVCKTGLQSGNLGFS